MQILENLKTETRVELDKILSSGKVSDVPASLKNYKQFCELIRFGLVAKKDEDLIRKIIKTFVHKIELLPGSYKLHLYVGQSHLDLVQARPGAPAPGAKQLEKQNKKAQENFSLGPSENFLFDGSNRLTIGWGGRTRTCE